MRTPDDVAAMKRLAALGWGKKRIARELGVDPKTVRAWLAKDGWRPYARPRRKRTLDGLDAWLRDRIVQHRGNAAVVRDELRREHGVDVSLRTVERAVVEHRRRLAAEARATVRFDTPPGRQLQVDFGELRVQVGGVVQTVHLCVCTLGWSRRISVWASPTERQADWFAGLEHAFHRFGGTTDELLVDNPRALVRRHDVATREVEFNATFLAFCRYWSVRPRACAPYRVRTKGKDENAVGYVKRNAIAGRTFASWDVLQAWLDQWADEIADVRIHGTTGERPIDRFAREEAQKLRAHEGRPPFHRPRELVRKVGVDACVEVDTNAYSVPWEHIGLVVDVVVGDEVVVVHEGVELARHPVVPGRRQRRVDPRHLAGVVGAPGWARTAAAPREAPLAAEPDARLGGELLRPLRDYEAVVGGAW